ncbi:hypothetical protein BU16DRAFT_197163 [Lophium mytilinum]|uniref:Uncharacterized protein n=1 Tax=Lophium mytilinum TaxID=390894 RepID=A0A6A6RD62_9PEZI|nr:hypothetical protein BU16DRAFT_197163 [Lophium mytilinum]
MMRIMSTTQGERQLRDLHPLMRRDASQYPALHGQGSTAWTSWRWRLSVGCWIAFCLRSSVASWLSLGEAGDVSRARESGWAPSLSCPANLFGGSNLTRFPSHQPYKRHHRLHLSSSSQPPSKPPACAISCTIRRRLPLLARSSRSSLSFSPIDPAITIIPWLTSIRPTIASPSRP